MWFLALFCLQSCISFSGFYKVLEGARLTIPEHEKIFILPALYSSISRISFDSRIIFKLKKASDVFSIYSGEVVEINEKLKKVVIKQNKDGKEISITYFGIDQILVKKRAKIQQGNRIGVCINLFSLQVRINDVIVNLLDYIPKTQRKNITPLII